MRMRVLSAAVLVGALLVPAATTASAGTVAPAFVRVDQVGYVAGGAKRAWLLSSTDLSGSTFQLRNGVQRRRLHRDGRHRPRSVERQVHACVPPGLRELHILRHLPGHGLGCHLAAVPHRHRRRPVHPSRAQRRSLLPRTARRCQRRPESAAPQAFAPQRRTCLGLCHPALQRRRRAPGRAQEDRRAPQRGGRLVRRGGLHQVHGHDVVRRESHAARGARPPGGRRPRPHPRRSPPRGELVAEDVERSTEDPLLPGGDRWRQRQDPRRPRHLAAPADATTTTKGSRIATSRTDRCSATGLPARASPHRWPGASRRSSACAPRCGTARRTATAACARGRTCSRSHAPIMWARRSRRRRATTIRRTPGPTTSSTARSSCTWACASLGRRSPSSAGARPASTCGPRRTGPTSTCTRTRTPATRSISTTRRRWRTRSCTGRSAPRATADST